MPGLLAAVLFWSAAQGASPSFDCRKALSAAEKAICRSPALAALDRKMADRYRRLRAALSPAGREAMRREQRRYIRTLDAECRVAARRAILPQSFAKCLDLSLRERTRRFSTIATRAGGHLFLQTDWRYSRRVADEDRHIGNMFEISRLPFRIDSPDAAGRRWNAVIEQRLRAVEKLALPGETPGDYRHADYPAQIATEVTITAASPDIVSAEIGGWGYYGGAHGESHSATLIWSLARGRAIANREIFDPRAPALGRLVGARYGLADEKRGCNAPALASAKLTIDRAGLRFVFDPYELGGYTCGGEARISWPEAAPYLRKPLPFDPIRLETPAPIVR